MERRAIDAIIWGLPLVGEDAVKRATFRDGRANYNAAVWWPKGRLGEPVAYSHRQHALYVFIRQHKTRQAGRGGLPLAGKLPDIDPVP